jgi:hypothetical protein
MKSKQVFIASDGSEHPTADAAVLRDRITAAEQKYHDAVRTLLDELRDIAITADGVPISELGYWWWEVRDLCGQAPEIIQRRYSSWIDKVIFDRDSGCVLVRSTVNGHTYDTPTTRLYAKEGNAKAACLSVLEAFYADIGKRVEKERAAVVKGGKQ